MILRRYLTSQVATTTALVLGFLVVMLLGGRLIRYFGIAAEGGLNVGVLFSLIGYNLPYFLELILPLSFFISLMLVFGRLYSDHEMAVINASGISRSQLGRLLIPLGLLLAIAEGWVSFVAKPWGMYRASNIWQEQSMAQVFDLIRPKQFISSGNYHLYVGEIGQRRESLGDVIIVQMAKNQADNRNVTDKSAKKDTLIFAKSATQTLLDNGQIQLNLYQGRRYEINPASRQYSQVGFDSYRMTLTAPKADESKQLRIEAVSTPALIEVIRGTLDRNRNEAMAELGYRASMPWLMVLALMMALPLSYTRPRQGRWLKLIPAIFIYVASVLVVISLKDSITKGKLPVGSYAVAMVLLTAFALYLNYHERWVVRIRLNRKKPDGN